MRLWLALLLVVGCSRAGYEPTPVRAPATVETPIRPPPPPPNPCAGVTCSGQGTCFLDDSDVSCACNAGYHVDGTSCVADGCVPSGVAVTTRCEQGDVRSFDNCDVQVAVVAACTDDVCGAPTQGTCNTAQTADGVCCLDSICGDSRITGDEACDTNDGFFCEDYGYGEGTLVCADNCTRLDIRGCTDACGNGIVENDEQCDGTQFSEQSGEDYCDSYCYGRNDHGPISCTPACKTFCNCYT